MEHISTPMPTMADSRNDNTHSPAVRRIAGPLEGYRLGVTDVPVRIYDLNLQGCLVEQGFGPLIIKGMRLQIDLPGEGWTVVECDMHHLAGPDTLAVTFTRMAEETRNRIARALERLGDRPPEDDASVFQRGGR